MSTSVPRQRGGCEEFEEIPGWRVIRTADLPDGINGVTRWGDRTIWLADHLGRLYLRFVFEHERQHALRGPLGGARTAEEIIEEENLCNQLAAEAMWAAGLPVDVDWLDYDDEWVHELVARREKRLA
jgi:hypothetical protein